MHPAPSATEKPQLLAGWFGFRPLRHERLKRLQGRMESGTITLPSGTPPRALPPSVALGEILRPPPTHREPLPLAPLPASMLIRARDRGVPAARVGLLPLSADAADMIFATVEAGIRLAGSGAAPSRQGGIQPPGGYSVPDATAASPGEAAWRRTDLGSRLTMATIGPPQADATINASGAAVAQDTPSVPDLLARGMPGNGTVIGEPVSVVSTKREIAPHPHDGAAQAGDVQRSAQDMFGYRQEAEVAGERGSCFPCRRLNPAGSIFLLSLWL